MALTLATPRSSNKKLKGKRPIASTQRTPDTCADDCPFNRLQDDGTRKPSCYAASGPGGGVFALTRRSGSNDVAGQMDRIVDGTPVGGVVRHLVSGDLTREYVEAANEMHAARPDLEGYGYTHKWREGWLSPASFDGWTVNASCETTEEIKKALADGWQAVVESPAGSLLAGTRVAGRRVVGCPAQADERVKCADCRLCLTDTATRPVIEFTLHGGSIKANTASITALRS